MTIEIGGHYDEVYSLKEFMKKLDFNQKAKGNVMQIFMGDRIHTTLTKKFNPNTENVKTIKNALRKTKTKLFIHANLRVNLAAPLAPRYMWNHDNVIYDMVVGRKIGAIGVVVHLGTRTLQGKLMSAKEAYQNMKKSIHYILSKSPPVIKLILEVNAGQSNKIGRTIEEIARVYHSLSTTDQKRVGFCWDTAHLYTAGYHMDTVDGVQAYLHEFKEKIGYRKIWVTHLNDSATEFDSGVDRHQNLGEGYIYQGSNWEPLEIISELLRREKVPLVLETRDPKKYASEIKLVRELAKKGKSKLSKQKKGGGIGGDSDVISILRKMQTLHLILGNQHQARAYRNAVSLIQTYLLQKDLNKIRAIDLDDLAKLEGIGKETISKIQEIMQTGRLSRIQELLKAVPYTKKQIEIMIELEGVMGVGPKIARKMVDQGINGVGDLKKPGKWKLTEMQKIGVKYYKDLNEKIPRKEVEKWRDSIISKIQKTNKGARGVLAGSYRLGKKASGDIDLILLIPTIKTVSDLEKHGGIVMDQILKEIRGILKDYLRMGDGEILGMVKDSKISNKVRHIDLKIVPKESMPSFMLYFGSGERFSRRIRADAKKKGYKLSQWGLYKGKTLVDVKDEKGIFEKLGMEYIAPGDRLF